MRKVSIGDEDDGSVIDMEMNALLPPRFKTINNSNQKFKTQQSSNFIEPKTDDNVRKRKKDLLKVQISQNQKKRKEDKQNKNKEKNRRDTNMRSLNDKLRKKHESFKKQQEVNKEIKRLEDYLKQKDDEQIESTD